MPFKQGYYTPRHPEKYVGNVKRVRYLSSWELKTHQFFDNNPNILRWSSEPFAIPYLNPIDQRIHNYLPDHWIEYRTKDGSIKRDIVEIKPEKELIVPSATGKRRQQYLYEALTFVRNKAKWQAAQVFCDKNNMSFRILTERQVFGCR